MARNHEELICWRLADELWQLIVASTGEGTAAARDFRFTSNLRDAIASACRHQSEGFYKFKHREMRPFFNTARASLGEVKDGITDGSERQYFDAGLTARMRSLCRRATVANLRFLRSLKRPDPPEPESD